MLSALLTALYYHSHEFMINWWKHEDYSYCYLVPFIVLYILWKKRFEFIKFGARPEWIGIFPLLVGILFYWIGELGGEYYIIYLSSWLVLVGLCILHLGIKKFRTILFPVCMILTMFPFPNFFNNRITLTLKLLSSKIGVLMMQAFGLSAYREGNVIDLGFTQLQVVDACSGLRYLLPLVVLSLLLAYYLKIAWWKKILVVLSAIPISIIVNSLRIVFVALLYPILGPQVAEGFFHGFSGWLIFMVSIGLLLIEIRVLGKIGKTPLKVDSQHSNQTFDIKVQASCKSPGFFQPHFIVGVLLLGGTLVLSQGIEFREKMPIAKSFDSFPMQVGEWIGQREGMEQKFIDALNLSDYIIVNFRNQSGKSVSFYVAYYESQRKGESIHSPETCLPGGGWVFNHSGVATLPLKNHNPVEMAVNRVFMQKGGYRQLSYFWFPQRGRILTRLYQLKLYNFWDALTRQRTDGALVRLVTPVGEMESAVDADRRLLGFVQDVVPVLDVFLPK